MRRHHWLGVATDAADDGRGAHHGAVWMEARVATAEFEWTGPHAAEHHGHALDAGGRVQYRRIDHIEASALVVCAGVCVCGYRRVLRTQPPKPPPRKTAGNRDETRCARACVCRAVTPAHGRTGG